MPVPLEPVDAAGWLIGHRSVPGLGAHTARARWPARRTLRRRQASAIPHSGKAEEDGPPRRRPLRRGRPPPARWPPGPIVRSRASAARDRLRCSAWRLGGPALVARKGVHGASGHAASPPGTGECFRRPGAGRHWRSGSHEPRGGALLLLRLAILRSAFWSRTQRMRPTLPSIPSRFISLIRVETKEREAPTRSARSCW